MTTLSRRLLAGLALLGILFSFVNATTGSASDERFILVASTTSTADSGLYTYLLPIFTEKTGIEARVVARGTGEAIELAKRGDADVLLVHNKPSEEQFVAEGYGVERKDLMYNDFVLIGPKADPAGIRGGRDAVAALTAIARAEAPFASRGDDSGTHKAEMKLWSATGIDVARASGTWYRALGSGMGATLNTAAGMGAYVLSDRATWAAFQNKADLEILVEGDRALSNQYGVILVNPAKFPHVKAADGQAFIDWLLSDEGQQAIASFTIDGQQVFYPNAERLSN